MKKLLLLITIISLSFTSSYASHLMGGEITYTHVAGDTYEVTLLVYRDCSGIPVNQNQTVTFQSASCVQNFAFNIPFIQINDVSQVCVGQLTTCNGGFLPGTWQYVFRGIVTLTPCSDWIMSWNNGTRNPDITNLVAPANRNLFIVTTLNNIAAPFNNSPQYFNPPTPYLCVSNLAILSHGATDADGDSLYYSLAQPLTTPGPPGVPIPFVAGHSILQPVITTSGLTLDQETGKMCFTPSQAQVTVISVLIKEYRNTVLIGTLIREMQVVIDGTCINSPPSTTGTPTCDGALLALDLVNSGTSVIQLDDNSISMCPSDNVCFDVAFSDLDGHNIVVTSNYFNSLPGATFTVLNDSTPNPIATVCWIPTVLDSGLNVLTILALDDGCPIRVSQSFIFDITVNDQPYAGPDITICETETAQLSTNGGATSAWYYDDGIGGNLVPVGLEFSCNPCSTPIATPLVTTAYYVVNALTAATCDSTDTLIITVIPGYTLSSNQSDTNICVGDVINFYTTPSLIGGYTYSWASNTGIFGTPNDSITGGTFNTPGPDTVIVTVNNVNCSLTDTFFVNVSAIPNINITTPDTLLNCVSILPALPINVDLGAAPVPNNFSFSWNFGTTLDDPTVQNPNATPTQAITNYIVIVTDTLGNCFGTDSIEVRVCCITPTVTFTNSTCFGADDGKIVVSATDPFSDLTIEFHNNDAGFTLLQTFTGNNPADSIENLVPGSYIVMIINPVGCSYNETITITEPTPVTLGHVTSNTIICIGGTVTLSGIPNGTIAPINLVWDNGLIGSGPHNVNPTANSTTYNVYAQDANNCVSDTQSIIIDLFPPITINSFDIMRDIICVGDTTIIRVDATGGGTNLIYTWMNGNGDTINITAANQLIITPSYDGEIYAVIVSDNCTTPTQTDSIATDWADLVLPTYTVANIAGCYNEIVPSITNTTPGLSNMASVLWDFGDGETDNFPFGAPFPYSYDNPGIYDITLIVTDQYGCQWDTVMPQYQIDAHDNPTADFSWNPNPTDYLNAQITFDNQSTENLYNQWIFVTNAQYTSNDIDPIFQFPQGQPGSYDVTLTVTNSFGCQDSISKVVVIDDVFLFYIPTGFTPDGDGLNDQFKVVGEGLDLNSFKMTVFNKWGQMVFESTNPDIGWDGTQSGSLVPDGVYVWKIEAKEAHSSIVHNKDGFVSIVR